MPKISVFVWNSQVQGVNTQVGSSLLTQARSPCSPAPGVYQMSVSEAAVPGEEVGRVKAKDPDIGENGLVAYSIIDGDGMDMFEITTDYETQEGVVKLKKVSDAKCSLLLTEYLVIMDYHLS